jgi:hypothetical protein
VAARFHLGWFLTNSFGVHGWNQPWGGNLARDWMKPDMHIGLAEALEGAYFDFLLLEDSSFVPDSYGSSMDYYLKAAAHTGDDASWNRADHIDIVLSALPSREALRTLLAKMSVCGNSAVALARLNRDFHTEVMSRAPNAFLREHVQELWDRCWQFSSTSFFDFMPQRMATLPIEGGILALQLHILASSESMGHHDSEIMDDGGLDRGDAGALGVVAARREGSDAAFVHARAGGGVSGIVSGRAPWL